MTEAESEFLLPYTGHCFSLMRDALWFAIESRIEHSQLLSGTADFLAIVDSTLHVVDLKTGAGVMVDPAENDQLLAYAYMAMVASTVITPRVVLTIVQPTDEGKPVKSWETTADVVLAWGTKAEAAIQAALQGASELVPGEHCRWCKAKPVCPKLRGVLDTLPAGLDVRELSPEMTADVLERADLVLQFIDAVRAHGHDLASRGITVPGWTLKPKRATRSWADEDAVLEIARRRKIKIWQDKLMSPAMAEKAHPNLPQELRDQIVAVSSGTNLVKGDPAPAVVLKPEASKTERLRANLNLLKYRR
jgi:hypothetical protein